MKNFLLKTVRFGGVFLSICLFAPLVSALTATHPLDPLSADEIESAVKILKTMNGFPKKVLFSTVQLNEPPKAEVWTCRSKESSALLCRLFQPTRMRSEF